MSPLAGIGLELRAGERRLVWLMVANYFLLLLFYYLLKPTRDSLFLVEASAENLPWVYMLTALVAAPVTAAYARAGLRRRLDHLIVLTSATLIAVLLALRLVMPVAGAWAPYIFYSFVGVAGGLTTSQFWLLANGVFDAAQAKRIFPILSLGGIVGAFAGGEITGLLVRAVGVSTLDLLLVAAVVLAVGAGFSSQAFRRALGVAGTLAETGRFEDEAVSDRGLVRSILSSRHLTLTVGIIALTVMTASFVDYEFKSVSVAAHPDQAELTAFLGRFYGRMSLVSLAVQVLLGARLIRWLGAGGVLLVLPSVLLLGSGAMIVMPGLLAGMLMRGADIGLKYSLDKTSRELLFLPIPLALKKRTKIFIDMFVDRWARGIAGFMLLICTAVLGFGLREIAVVMLVLVLVWLGLALLMRREYLNSFRRALSRREIDLRDLRVRIDDAAAIEVLIQALDSGRSRDVVYALGMLEGIRADGLADRVRPLLDHPAPDVRRRAVAVLSRNATASDGERLARLLDDEDLAVRTAAVGVLAAREDAATALPALLTGSARRRNALLAYLAHPQPGGPGVPAAVVASVDGAVAAAVLADEGPDAAEGRAQLAELLWLPAGAPTDLWDRLLADPEPAVVNAAMAGLGARGETDRAGWLLAQLGEPDLRLPARRALVRLGAGDPTVLDLIEEFFRNPDNPRRLRAEVPRILAQVPLAESVAILQRHLATQVPELRYEVLKALGRLRSRHRNLKFDAKLISAEITVETGRYVQLAGVAAHLPLTGEAALLLRRTVGETQRLRLESVFRLLALIYPPRDVLNAYNGVVSGRRVLKANAQEFLDNLLAGAHRRLVLSLIDEQPAVAAFAQSDLNPGPAARTTAEALDFLAGSCDPWLAACALNAGAAVPNPAALCFLERQGDDMLTTIEKVLLLQNLEVFTEVPTDQLAALATITRERSVLAGDVIYQEDDLPDSLYLVLSGRVRLHRGEQVLTHATAGDSFGTWALFDDEPRVMTATASEDTRLLRIDRVDFADLLADDVRIAQGVIRTVARRLRDLAGRAV